MYLILTSSLTHNEILVLELLMRSLNIHHSGIVQLNSDAPPTLETVLAHKLILVYNDAKSKPQFVKNLEATYGKDILKKMEGHLRIDRPNTFNSSRETQTAVWESLRQWTSAHKIQTTKLDVSKITTSLPKELVDQFLNGGSRSVYILDIPDGSKMEIRPDEIKPSQPNSLTYTEFFVLVTAKTSFAFDKFSVIKAA